MARPHLHQLRILPSRLTPSKAEDRASVEVYRPFFTAGILTVLTAGCLLGAIALFGISRAGSYTISAWTPHILAHANSQLFGWVGFFVMGFALQQHAPSIARARTFHVLAWASLGLMAAGIALRFAAEPLVGIDRTLGIPLGVFAGVLQLVAVVLFMTNTTVTRHRGSSKLGWESVFVFGSLFWMFVVALAEPFAFLGSHQADRMSAIQFVAEWFPPLREAQFLGFVAMMVFGVSMTKFSSCFYAQSADKTNGMIGFGWWTIGLLLRMFGWVYAFRNGMQGNTESVYFAGGVCLAIGAVYVASATKLFGKLSESIRSHKFLRAAYSWLVVAGILMVVEPMVLRWLGQPFSHAYTGAIRHAVTVGFISQMIIGVGSHVAARMNDLEDATLPQLWPTFWLLNIGNLLRVVCEIATDFTPAAFAPMGFTGFVELVGLALWAAAMARAMYPRLRRGIAGVPHAR